MLPEPRPMVRYHRNCIAGLSTTSNPSDVPRKMKYIATGIDRFVMHRYKMLPPSVSSSPAGLILKHEVSSLYLFRAVYCWELGSPSSQSVGWSERVDDVLTCIKYYRHCSRLATTEHHPSKSSCLLCVWDIDCE